jgi:hypothetical protein
MTSTDHEPTAVQVSKTADGITTIIISREHRRNAVGQYKESTEKLPKEALTSVPSLQQTAQQPASSTQPSSPLKQTQHKESAFSTATTVTSALASISTSCPPRTTSPNQKATMGPSSTPSTASRKETSDPWAHHDSSQRNPSYPLWLATL